MLACSPTFASGSAPLRHRQSILEQLALEWRHISIRADELRRVRAWGLPGHEIRSLDDVLDRCGFLPAPDRGDAPARTIVERPHHDTAAETAHDAYLLRLLEIARSDALAGRIVLERLLPGLCMMARKYAHHPAVQADLMSELVSNAWLAILTYPVERRPRRVVANLIRDIGFQTVFRPLRRRASSEIRTGDHRWLDRMQVEHVEPLDELVDVLTEARRRGMNDADLGLLCEIVSTGRSQAIAAEHHVTDRTIRNRRDALARRVRALNRIAA
jgi:hypothetical protein